VVKVICHKATSLPQSYSPGCEMCNL